MYRRSNTSPYMHLSSALAGCASFFVFSDSCQYGYGTFNSHEGGGIKAEEISNLFKMNAAFL